MAEKAINGVIVNGQIYDILSLTNPIGSVITSTTCDTMAKVIQTYGGTKWIQHKGYILKGADSNVTSNNGTKDGGNNTLSYTPKGSNTGGAVNGHALTNAQLPVTEGRLNFRAIYNDNQVVASGSGVFGYEQLGAGDYTWQNCINTSGKTKKTDLVTFSFGGNQQHSHGFVNPRFTGTTETLNVEQAYKNVYIWERVE